MNMLFKIIAAVALLSTAACNENGNPVKTAGSDVFKTQTKALDNAKKVEQTLIDNAQQQREKINAQTQ